MYHHSFDPASSELFRGSIRAVPCSCKYESLACSSNQVDGDIDSLGSVDIPEVVSKAVNVRRFCAYFVTNRIGLIITCKRGYVLVEGGRK